MVRCRLAPAISIMSVPALTTLSHVRPDFDAMVSNLKAWTLKFEDPVLITPHREDYTALSENEIKPAASVHGN